jgi:MinD superfamily P-loop ATPase
MIVAFASGKGGAGKTTVAVNLALTLARRRPDVRLLDADVEEPNARLFLELSEAHEERVAVPNPVVDPARCERCGACTDHCRFGAILMLGGTPTVFPELCHACGGCALACPTGAITERPREIGTVEHGRGHGMAFTGGRLDVGEPRAVPLVEAVKSHNHPRGLTLLDAPPGSGCAMMAAVDGVDLVCFVAEPTPFGIHDLELAMAAVEQQGLPVCVVVNRQDLGDGELERNLADRDVEILTAFPEDRRIAEVTSRGERVIDALPSYRAVFTALADRLEKRLAIEAERGAPGRGAA